MQQPIISAEEESAWLFWKAVIISVKEDPPETAEVSDNPDVIPENCRLSYTEYAISGRHFHRNWKQTANIIRMGICVLVKMKDMQKSFKILHRKHLPADWMSE